MDTEDSRRAGFVDKLLDMDANTTPHQVEDASDGATSVDSRSIEDSYSVHEKKETYLVNRTGKLWIKSSFQFFVSKEFMNNVWNNHDLDGDHFLPSITF